MLNKFIGIDIVVDGNTYKQFTEMSGALYYEVGETCIFATPYYETEESVVPIEIIDNGEILNMSYSFINKDNEIKEYENLVKMLITNVLIKS